MKRFFRFIAIIVFSGIVAAGFSQVSQGGMPLSSLNTQLQKTALAYETMPKVDVERLQSEDIINDKNKDIPWRFGENIDVDYNLSNSGVWDVLPQGDRVWRLAIKSAGALTINLTFNTYHLPPGAKLFVYNADKSEVIGAFTDFNNQESGVFATTLVRGDQMVIEYDEPANPQFPGQLNLTRVTHGYRSAFEYAKSFGTSGSCNNNVLCPEAAGWENQVRSVCMLVTGGSGFCTGAVINNTSQNGVPYVLTANHCYSDPTSWVFWFNWQSPTCANPASSPPYNALSGATLKARKTDSDFCLVQMSSTPPATYNVYYAGWNRENVGASSGAGVHHPDGDIKKISYSVTPFTSDTYTGTPADSHWKVNWSDGVTEPGSSGSPMFDQNHRLIGQLHGGPSSCTATSLWDFYGKFSMSWAQGTTSADRLKDWLDPTNIAGLTLDGLDPYATLNAIFVANTTTICEGSSVTFTNSSTGSPTSWNWSFPGGTPSSWSGATPPAITYSTAGSYDVTLIVGDGTTTDTEAKTGYIQVKTVIADFSGTPNPVVVGNAVTFTDNSLCTPATWAWSFPGGTPSSYTGQTPPPIAYNSIGAYDVSLTVTKSGSTDTRTRTGYVVVTPPIFNMANGSVTTCAGDFFDSGGSAGSYSSNETFVETFYPSSPANMIRFTFSAFSTESGYDTLTIYNGPTSSYAVIGKYHGTTSPGTVTASNASGALTFRFHSDGTVVSTGWAAAISCYNTSVPPVADFSASTTAPIVGQTVTFTDLSTNIPTSWAWSFSPATVTYVGGTNATSQNPQVQFSDAGAYTISLTATNAFGSDPEVKVNYVNVTNCTISAYPWTEGFENGGVIPNCWAQEQVSSSGIYYTFVLGNGAGYPAAAHGGVLNACLKDATSADNKTKLITPALNLTALPSPQLKFWHTQIYWSPDQDQLSVFYKTSLAGTWTLLTTYTAAIATWTQETIPLPSASATYYIAFEGNAKYGRGICIDDVEISSSCTILTVGNVIVASANPVTEGTSVTFTATGSNGGTTPAYQWKVNGADISGATNTTYAYVPVNNDAVTCVLTSNATCVINNPATSNTINMVVNSAVPTTTTVQNITVSATQCFNAQQTIIVAGSGTTFTVQNGGSSTMIAGENILYYPGTIVEPGGYMYGYISPEGPWCATGKIAAVEPENNENRKDLKQKACSIFPNPTTGTFMLELHSPDVSAKYLIEIFNMKGAKMLSAELTNERRHEFSLSGKSPGIYLVRISDGATTESVRVIKQ